MAKLEIPSIVVHSGSPSVPGVSMDRTARQAPQLRKQKSSLDEGDSVASGCIHHSKVESTSPGPNNNNNANNNNNNQQESKSPERSSGPGSGSKPSSPGSCSPKNDDTEKPASGPQPQLSRSRSNGKMKMLTRSHAMREATSPPPDPSAAAQAPTTTSSSAVTTSATTLTNSQPPTVTSTSNSNAKNNSQASKSNNNSNNNNSGSGNNTSSSNSNSNNNNNNNKSKNSNNKSNKEQNNASSNRANHRQNNKNIIYINSPIESWAGLLCRDSSTDIPFQEVAKADLDAFIAQQMSTKNRPLLLRIEDELTQLVHDTRPVYFRFPPMSSFHRMIVHRAATYFNMDHNVDQSGCVVVNRTKSTKLPEKNFLQIMRDMKGLNNRAFSSEEPRKSILKRDYASFEDSQYKSDDKQLSLESRRSKSFEEREEEYERARRRIFSRDDSSDSCNRNSDSNQDSMEDLRWNENASWASADPEQPGRYLRPNDRSPRLLKTESYESRDSLKANSMRNTVSKSYSFGGYTPNNAGNNARVGPSHGQSYTGLQRGDSSTSSVSTGSRMLAKQDSGSSASSRLSPSSSGYKSQSQQSDATLSATPSPTATPLSLLPMSSHGSQDTLSPEPPVIWPMTALGNIPSGSVLINPATGQPICNADGSVYRYDPENPLTLHVPQPESPKQTLPSPTSLQEKTVVKGNEKSVQDVKNWAANSSNQTSPKASQAPNASAPKTAQPNDVNQALPVSTHQEPAKPRESQKPANASDKAQDNAAKAKDSSQEKRAQGGPAQAQHDFRKSDRDRQISPSKAGGGSERDATPSSLNVPPPESSFRSVMSASTSPMLLQSPQRQAGQPLVVPVGYPMGGAPQQPQVQMMPVMGQAPTTAGVYPVQPNGVTHYHNGSYVPGFATPDVQTYVNGYPAVPYVPHMASYPVNVDPATGAYVAHQQQASCANNVCQQGAPCCAPGYPCPYGGQVMATAPAPVAPSGPHPGYEQRNVEPGGQAVNDMSNYMMSMNLNGGTVIDQRAGGDVPASRADGPSPQQGPGGPQAPHVMVAGSGSYYWGPQLSSHNQGYPPTVMYYYPQNNMSSPQNSAGSGSGPVPTTAVSAGFNSSYNQGSSSISNNRENGNNKNYSVSSSSANSSPSDNSNRNNYNRNVAASFAKGAAIYQPPVYSVPVTGPNIPLQANGYPNDCVAAPQQQVVYAVSSMHSSTVPTQSYQPSVYSSAGAAMTPSTNAPHGTLAYYQGIQGGNDSSNQSQGQQLVPVNPYAGPQGYLPTPATPPLTPQSSYGVHPYLYGMYPQAPNGPGGPASPATYPNQSPMMRGMMRPNLVVSGVHSSPPPRGVGHKGFPRGQSPVGRKDQSGSGDSIRYPQPYSVPMYNIAASRYMSGDMRYMAGRLPFSIPTNTYHRAIRPFQTSYYPRPHSQPSGEALSLTRTPRIRKPTSTEARGQGPARGGPFVGKEFNTFSKPPVVMKTS